MSEMNRRTQSNNYKSRKGNEIIKTAERGGSRKSYEGDRVKETSTASKEIQAYDSYNEKIASGFYNEKNVSGFYYEKKASGFNKKEKASGINKKEKASGYNKEKKALGYNKEKKASDINKDKKAFGLNKKKASGFNKEEKAYGLNLEKKATGYPIDITTQEDYFEDLDLNILTKEEKAKYSPNNIKGTSNTGKYREDSKQEYKANGRQPKYNDRQGSSKQGNQGGDFKSGQRTKESGNKASVSGLEYKKSRNSTDRIDNRTAPVGKSVNKGTCPYIRDCGGCNILQQSYEAELKQKQKTVEKLIGKYCKVEQILGMKNPNHYRNKVHVVFDHDKKGNAVSGVYEEGTHRVIPVDKCLIHNQKADEIIKTIRDMLKSFKIKTYDEDTGYGLLRHVLIRTGFNSKEILVVLVLASPILPSKKNFVNALLKKHPEITTIVINVNDKRTSMVLGEKEHVIYGKGYIEDSLCGKVFRISPKSFYQVNPAQTELLYNKAIKMAGLTGSETVIDAYCGTGTIGIIASDYAKRVIGVELNQDAVRDANINVKRNDTKNIDFYNNDAGKFMSQMAAQMESTDVVFMDPPRTGSSEEFMDALVVLKPKKVVYISCNPVTLERDLAYLTKKGFKAEKAVPVDMFPWTSHVESIVLLQRKNS